MMFSFNETRWKYISLGGGKAFRVKQIHGQWQEKDFFFFVGINYVCRRRGGGEGGGTCLPVMKSDDICKIVVRQTHAKTKKKRWP